MKCSQHFTEATGETIFFTTRSKTHERAELSSSHYEVLWFSLYLKRFWNPIFVFKRIHKNSNRISILKV